MMEDCQWSGIGQVWEDINQNGQREEIEKAISGVGFFADDVLNNYHKMPVGTSDATGRAGLFLFLAGCPAYQLEVYIERPSGYCLTTTERLANPGHSTFDFGLIPCQ